MKLTKSIAYIASLLVFCSCVSQKKYNDLLGSKARAEHEVARLTEIEKAHNKMTVELDNTYATLADREAELMALKDERRKLEGNYEELKSQYDVLLENNRSLLASASDEKKELMTRLTAQQNELDDKARQLNRLKEELEIKEAALAEREESIAELSAQLDAQRQSLQSLKSGLNDALRGFSASDLTVVERDGKIYVSMSQNLLFASGSNKVDQKGKDALAKLAEVLNANPDIDILIEGHTDTDGTADFNWDLSATRATAVTKVLTMHKVDPKRITAAGRAYYVPVASNDTEEGKARNRRTEIILAPKLDRLYELIK